MKSFSRIFKSLVSPAAFTLLVQAVIFSLPVQAQSGRDPLAASRYRDQEHVREVIEKAKQDPSEPGQSMADWAMSKWDGEKFEKHPWFDGNKEWPQMWLEDTRKIVYEDPMLFWECMEPKLVQFGCEYCEPPIWPGYIDPDCKIPFYNLGMVFEYWWPELEIETNNFGISAINPVHLGRIDYAREMLIQKLEQFFKRSYQTYGNELDKDFEQPEYEVKGYSHHAGNQPVDATQVLEGHNYLTLVQTVLSLLRCQGCGLYDFIYEEIYGVCVPLLSFTYNGYVKGNPDYCFYDTLEPVSHTIKAWTEDAFYADWWRIPERSAIINQELYFSSVTMSPFFTSPETFAKQVQANKMMFYNMCPSYRLATWADFYSDLMNLGVQPYTSETLRKICYYGGGELYPLAGTLMGNYHPLTSAAYLARRSVELAGMVGHSHLWCCNNHCSDQDHVNRFTRLKEAIDDKFTEVDKLQRVFPDKKATRCFRMNEVDDFDRELFPPDLEKPEHLGSIRHIYWNKRTACACELRGDRHSLERDNGPDPWTSWLIKLLFPRLSNHGWGCQIYPRKPMDPGRGNLEEGEIEGSDGFLSGIIASVVPMCVYPFPTPSKCAVRDGVLMEESERDDKEECERVPMSLVPMGALGKSGMSAAPSKGEGAPRQESLGQF